MAVSIPAWDNTLETRPKEMGAPTSFNPSFVRVNSRKTAQAIPDQHAVCSNCGHTHQRLHNSSPANCFFITIRRSGRERLPLSASQTITIPMTETPLTQSRANSKPAPPVYHPAQHHLLRDFIWNEFESLKAEVDLDRDHIALQRDHKTKGQLRDKAPIPWLSWSSPAGQTGQTRNKANFYAIWDKVMSRSNREVKKGDVLVSSVLLPMMFDFSSLLEEVKVVPRAEHSLAVRTIDTCDILSAQDVPQSRWDCRRIVIT